MFRSESVLKNLVFVLILLFAWLSPEILLAHCDTFAGPVLIEAQKAMETGDVTPLLKWVKPDSEDAIKKAFAEAMKNRKTDQKKADNAFFELLIRIHREGEGAPFTGIKPAGTELPPAIVAADKALETGSSQALIDLLARDLTAKVQARFDLALEKKRSAGKSVAQGREYVAAYVEYVHFVEALSELLAGEGGHDHEAGPAKSGSGKCSSCDAHGKQ
jgi:hypothetical protein